MQFTTTIFALLASALTVSAGTQVSVGYDTNYDSPILSTKSTACSDGSNGLFTKGYNTLGDLPNFPLVGASDQIPGWNSNQCGKCFKIFYQGTSIYVTAVDHAGNGFVLSKAAMDKLTGGQAQMLGRVNDAFYAPAAMNMCHM
ncbi:allergen Asp f 15 precursor [Wilcoxina mikolae CBS 423.85]|nr:allergen Asp f 15 precursor [Wilcoxina mikolae CBS 423.85]